MRTLWVWVACLAAACFLTAAGAFLWFDNVTVDVRASDVASDGPAGQAACDIAPWDAGLNGDREGPGGEHSTQYFDEVADDCYNANKKRFYEGVGSWGLAGLIIAAGFVVTARSARREPSPDR